MNQRQTDITRAANALSVPVAWLDALIRFESNYDPNARNRITGARGIIQVMDSTARSMFGVPNADHLMELYPTFTQQIDNVVIPYLAHYEPFPTQQSLYMAIFYPKYRAVDPNTIFSESVQLSNPNIKTVQDYINLVNRRMDPALLSGGFSLIAILVVMIFMYYRR